MQAMRILPIVALLIFGLLIATSGTKSENAKPSLEEALAQVEVPPDWFQAVEVHYDTGHPWEEARIEIRRLLSLGNEEVREAVKLTYLYVQKKDIGNGHEYPMYLFMGGEYAWALQEYKNHLKLYSEGNTHGYRSLAACYRHFGEYMKALETLDMAMQRLPEPPWQIANAASVYDSLGDIYAEMGDLHEAKRHYQKAIEIYPTSNQPYGRHLLHRKAAIVQTKLDLLDYQSIESGELRDGTYTGRSLGYVEDIIVTVTIKKGKIANIQLKHKEKIDQNATTIVPQRIIAQQSLKIDSVTGATVTYQSIVDGTFQALKKAGLK